MQMGSTGLCCMADVFVFILSSFKGTYQIIILYICCIASKNLHCEFLLYIILKFHLHVIPFACKMQKLMVMTYLFSASCPVFCKDICNPPIEPTHFQLGSALTASSGQHWLCLSLIFFFCTPQLQYDLLFSFICSTHFFQEKNE